MWMRIEKKKVLYKNRFLVVQFLGIVSLPACQSRLSVLACILQLADFSYGGANCRAVSSVDTNIIFIFIAQKEVQTASRTEQVVANITSVLAKNSMQMLSYPRSQSDAKLSEC